MNITVQTARGEVTYTEPKSKVFWKTVEFWTLVVDVVVNILFHVLAEYASSEVFDLVKYIVLQLQPLVLVVIGGLFAARVFTLHSKRQAAAYIAAWNTDLEEEE